MIGTDVVLPSATWTSPMGAKWGSSIGSTYREGRGGRSRKSAPIAHRPADRIAPRIVESRDPTQSCRDRGAACRLSERKEWGCAGLGQTKRVLGVGIGTRRNDGNGIPLMASDVDRRIETGDRIPARFDQEAVRVAPIRTDSGGSNQFIGVVEVVPRAVGAKGSEVCGSRDGVDDVNAWRARDRRDCQRT